MHYNTCSFRFYTGFNARAESFEKKKFILNKRILTLQYCVVKFIKLLSTYAGNMKCLYYINNEYYT